MLYKSLDKDTIAYKYLSTQYLYIFLKNDKKVIIKIFKKFFVLKIGLNQRYNWWLSLKFENKITWNIN